MFYSSRYQRFFGLAVILLFLVALSLLTSDTQLEANRLHSGSKLLSGDPGSVTCADLGLPKTCQSDGYQHLLKQAESRRVWDIALKLPSSFGTALTKKSIFELFPPRMNAHLIRSNVLAMAVTVES